MTKAKCLIMTLIIIAIMLILPNVSNAAVEVTRNIYSNNGSMKFNFTGLELDTTHEYEYGFSVTSAAEVTDWYLVKEYTDSTAVVEMLTTTKEMREIFNATDTGYVRIKDKTADVIILEPVALDFKIPFLRVTNFSVLSNGKEFTSSEEDCINVPIRCASNSEPYYQYEKITDQNVINKYKEIKSNDGNIFDMEDMLKTEIPESNWKTWSYWNGHDTFGGMNGFGYPTKNIDAPDTGLYYLWVYFSGENIKNVYGYILVDNLQPEIALESISIPDRMTIELDKVLTIIPTFTPSTATNKIVTWSSSDETVATIDNAGRITPKKVGSTIITVTSEDGNKQATCTLTVVESIDREPGNEEPGDGNLGDGNPDDGNPGDGNPGDGNPGGGNPGGGNPVDGTKAPGKIPHAGVEIGIVFSIITLICASAVVYSRYRKMSDI